MSYKALFTADLHMSNRLPFSKMVCNGMTDRLIDQINLLRHIISTAKNESVDGIFILGDVFDRALIDGVTLTHTIEELTKTDVPIYILAGNHDANSSKGGRFTVEAFGAMNHPQIHFLDKVFSPNKWLHFLPIPYATVEDTENKIDTYIKNKIDGVNILLFHNSVFGCGYHEWTCDDGIDPELMCDNFDYVFGGHFHSYQKFGKSKNGMFVGAPMHHNFGDCDRTSGFRIITFKKDGSRKIKFFEGNAPKFHITHKMRIDEKWCNGDYVRLEVECTHPEWVKISRDIDMFRETVSGVNLFSKHKPIYQHKKRLKSKDSKGGKTIIESSIDEYVNSSSIVTDGLDKNKLKNIGISILNNVRTINGII